MRNLVLISLAVGILLLAAGCAQDEKAPKRIITAQELEELRSRKTDFQIAQEDDVMEAVFRWQFDHNASGAQKNAAAYFLRVGKEGKDPSDAFMKRFEGHKPPVKKASQSRTDKISGVVDKETGKNGLVFRITRIIWISDTEALVEGGYYEAGLSASGNEYEVVKEGDKWTIKKDTMKWIS